MNASPKTASSTYANANAYGSSESLDDIIDRAATPEKQLCADMGNYLLEYARERPEVAALWCFGIGFVLGWRLKPW